MNLDVVGTVVAAGQVALMIAAFLSPVVFFGVLIWLAVRHLQGKHTPLEGLFNGIGRASAMNSHLQAGTPHPDDLAIPVPPPPGPGKRERRRRRPRSHR